MNKKTITGLVCLGLAGVLAIVAGFGSGWKYDVKNIGKWFKGWGKDSEKKAENLLGDGNGGLVLPETVKGNGVSMRSEALPRVWQNAYGVSEKAESAWKVTASIEPEYANATLLWTWDYANPSAEWAQDNPVSDCVNVTEVTDENAVILECINPFAAQITLTATVEEKPELSATLPLDYAQKLESMSLSFGDVVCNMGENGTETGVTVELGFSPMGVVHGGKPSLEVQLSSVYTIAEEYTVDYTLSGNYVFLGYEIGSSWGGLFFGEYVGTGEDLTSSEEAFSAYSVADNGLYFGIEYFSENLGLREAVPNLGDPSTHPVEQDINISTLIERFEKSGTTEGDEPFETHYGAEHKLFDLTVTINGKHFTVQKSTSFKMSGYTNTTPPQGITFDKDHIIF